MESHYVGLQARRCIVRMPSSSADVSAEIEEGVSWMEWLFRKPRASVLV